MAEKKDEKKAEERGFATPVIRSDLKQRDVRELELELATPQLSQRLLLKSSSSYHEAALKAAIGAGWIEEPECKKRTVEEKGEDGQVQRVTEYYYGEQLVDYMDPRECYRVAHPIVKLYDEFTSLDPT